jgi:hypothetical protein
MSVTPKKQSPLKNSDKDQDQQDYSYGSPFWKNAKTKIDSSPNTESLIVDYDVKNMFDYTKHCDKNNYIEKISDNNDKECVSVAQLLKKIKKPEVVNTIVSGKKVFAVL